MISLPSPDKLGSWLLAVALLLTVPSCTVPGLSSTAPRGWWRGDGVRGTPRIVINLSEQRVNYYKGGQLVGVSPISSGREGHNTVTGTYRIIDKDIDHRSSLYGAFCDANRQIVVPDVDASIDEAPRGTHFIGAAMPYFMRITGGIGMHEGYLPGYPASHGCIRLPGDMAHVFFNETPVGTPVEIIGDASLASARGVPPLPAPPGAPAEASALPPRHTAPLAVAKPLPPKTNPKAKAEAQSGWLRIGRITDKSKPKKLPFGTTIYLQQ